MQRIAVLPTDFPFLTKHNQYCDIDCDPYLYYDFDYAVYRDEENKTRPLRCVLISDLDMSQFSEKDIKVYKSQDGPAHISEEDNDKYRLIIIEHSRADWCHTCDYRLPVVEVPYSEKVRSTAMRVVNKMMGGSTQYSPLSGSIEECRLKLDYWCVHIRCTDRISSYNWTLSLPANIKRNLKMHKDINSDTLIYLMTDEPNDAYYDRLTKDYPNLFRYKDFPELYVLRHPADGINPNNYLLFAIERQIQFMAKKAIVPPWVWGEKRRWRLWPFDSSTGLPHILSSGVAYSLLEHYPLRKWFGFGHPRNPKTRQRKEIIRERSRHLLHTILRRQ